MVDFIELEIREREKEYKGILDELEELELKNPSIFKMEESIFNLWYRLKDRESLSRLKLIRSIYKQQRRKEPHKTKNTTKKATI